MKMNKSMEDAIQHAVKTAIEKLGLEKIKKGPFFGIGYKDMK